MSQPVSRVEAAYNRTREPGGPFWCELAESECIRLRKMWLAGAEDACSALLARGLLKKKPEPVT